MSREKEITVKGCGLMTRAPAAQAGQARQDCGPIATAPSATASAHASTCAHVPLPSARTQASTHAQWAPSTQAPPLPPSFPPPFFPPSLPLSRLPSLPLSILPSLPPSLPPFLSPLAPLPAVAVLHEILKHARLLALVYVQHHLQARAGTVGNACIICCMPGSHVHHRQVAKAQRAALGQDRRRQGGSASCNWTGQVGHRSQR